MTHLPNFENHFFSTELIQYYVDRIKSLFSKMLAVTKGKSKVEFLWYLPINLILYAL